jgi:hypothetical protein
MCKKFNRGAFSFVVFVLRFTATDYPFTIFKLVLNSNDTRSSQVTGLCRNSYRIIYTIIYWCSKDRATRTPLIPRVNARALEASYSTSGARRVTLVTNQVIRHEWEKELDKRNVIYLWKESYIISEINNNFKIFTCT